MVLQAGVIEQVGSPLELYQRPRNTFVAGFIGSPKMNLIQGPEADKCGAATIGIRPEHIDINEKEGLWQGTVGVSEHLGSDTFIHIQCKASREPLTVRATGEMALEYGAEVHVTPRPEHLHKFDSKGLRME